MKEAPFRPSGSSATQKKYNAFPASSAHRRLLRPSQADTRGGTLPKPRGGDSSREASASPSAFTSPSERAVRTAELALDRPAGMFRVSDDPAHRARHGAHGKASLGRNAIRQRSGKPSMKTRNTGRCPGGESYSEVGRRMEEAVLSTLEHAGTSETILIFTPGLRDRCAPPDLKGSWRGVQRDTTLNASITEIRLTPTGLLVLRADNDAAHLGDPEEPRRTSSSSWGHGSLCRAQRTERNPDVVPAAVISVADNGGSSGVLRDEHGVLPPGAFRSAPLPSGRDALLRDSCPLFPRKARTGHNVRKPPG